MFCPQCGTKATGTARFCRECGAEMGATTEQRDQDAGGRAQGASGQGWSASSTPSRPGPLLLAHVTVKDNPMRTLLLIGAAVLLLPLAIPLVLGTLLAGVVASVALVAIAIRLIPVLALGIVLYWIITHRRRAFHAGR